MKTRIKNPRPRRGAMAVWLMAFATTTAAAAAPAPTPQHIESLTFLGTEALPVSALQAATAPFIGRTLDEPTLAALRRAVQHQYDRAGYSLVAVATPAVIGQSGALVIRVTEFRVSDIQVSGSDAAALSRLPALSAGATPQLDQLTRELFLFNDNPRRQAALNFEPDGKDRIKARLKIEQRSPAYGSLTLDNSGTSATGRERLRLNLAHADLLQRGIVGELLAVASRDGHTVRQGVARVSVPILTTGGSVDLSVDHSRSDLGPVLAFSSISGRSTGVRAGYRHPLMRATNAEHFIDASIEQRSYDDVYDFAGVNLGSSVDTRPLTLGYSAIRRSRWVLQQGFSVTGNLPGGGNNSASQYAASRFGADEKWLRTNASTAALTGFGTGWQFSARLSAQYSRDALISGEQFRAGGASLVRGLIEGEIAGDSGLAFGIEIAAPWPGPLQPFVFADAARATRNLSPAGSPSKQSALTAGAGLRTNTAHWLGLEISAGHVLAQDHLPESDEGDTRVHASLRLSF